MEIREFDIIVVGAGPAGSTLIAYLIQSGLSIAAIDKADFPRDKICGDAIPGPAVRILEGISPDTRDRFEQFKAKQRAKGGTAIAPNHHQFSIYFKTKGYISRRIDFDHFLFEEAKINKHAEFFLKESIEQIDIQSEKVEVSLKGKNYKLQSQLIIGCDGANSIVARQLTQRTVNPTHHCAGVRAYYRKVNLKDEHMMEFYLLKNYLPGYFWIFPLGNDLYNVGFGMLSKDLAARKINLKHSLLRLIENDPLVKQTFSKAQLISPVLGFGLPLGSLKRIISGHRFLLCGDAAALIDPATGEGIGNAMISAKIAALMVKKCFEENRFDATFLKTYDKKIYARLWRSLKTKYLIQKLLKDRTWLLNFIIRVAGNNPLLRKIIGKIF